MIEGRKAPLFAANAEETTMINELKQMYADYQKAGKKFGVDKPEFYACLAKLFIEDPDAVDNKVEEYVKHVVKHEK